MTTKSIPSTSFIKELVTATAPYAKFTFGAMVIALLCMVADFLVIIA